MKRLLTLVIVSVIILSGCSHNVGYLNKTEFYLTAEPLFSNEQMEKLGLEAEVSEYCFENVQTYRCKDDKKAIYLYSAPIDEYSDLVAISDGCYESEGMYFNKRIPVTLSEETPIAINDNRSFAKLFLQDKEIEGEFCDRSNVFGVNKQALVYESAFGNGEDYICYFTPFGVNTEIVIPKRKNENRFQIKIQLPNLVPDTSSPDYILFRTALENGEVKCLLYTPLLVDKKGKTSYANYVKLIDKDSENNIYTVEYGVDEEFLNDKNTKFPVTLNQSIHLYKSKQPDTSAYESTGDVASHYLSPYMLLGDNTLKGEGWTYVRFEILNSLDIDPEKIVSAKYVFHNLFELKKETKISAYAVKADWCSINTRWFNRPPFDEKPVSEVLVKKAGDYKLDITTLFVEMMKNKGKENATYSIQNSFMIRSDTEDSNVIIPSGDNGVFSPVLEIVLSE